MTHTIDYSALTGPTTREEVRAFKAEQKAAGSTWGRGGVAGAIGLGVLTLAALLVVAGILVNLYVSVKFEVGSGRTPAGLTFPLIILAALGVVIVVTVRARIGSWERWMRLSRFASANDLVFSPSERGPSYPGLIFGQGHSALALNDLRSRSGRFLNLGSYQYTTGSGKSRRTHNWGFMALRLDRRLPHMLLDARSNNSWLGTNLPSIFDKEQVLALEGNFNEHFTLYCPREYERDALYIFTPDLMALLIDEASPFDVEIVDDWMFVYSSRPFAPLDPAVYQRLFRIVDTVGERTLAQSDRYVDERVGTFAANAVAPQGQRLKKGFPVVAVVIAVVFVVIWVLPEVADLFR